MHSKLPSQLFACIITILHHHLLMLLTMKLLMLTNPMVLPMCNSRSQFQFESRECFHLVSLLQQANLLSSAGPVSNHISTSYSLGHSPRDASQTVIYSIISCSIHATPDYWLLDSGANDHICSYLTSFTSFYKIKPINVNLPNGFSVLVQHAGNISFSPNLFLTNVLYSPDFKKPVYESK